MGRTLSLLIMLVAQTHLSTNANAQTQPRTCPTITVHEVAVQNPLIFPKFFGAVCPGAKITFVAEVTGIALEERPDFNWVIAGGEILNGQGTSRITVAGLDAREITAKVEVRGLKNVPPECETYASKTVHVSDCHIPCPSLTMSCPTESTDLGKLLTMSLNVSGGEPIVNPAYKWMVSAGKIISGQGTPEIRVDTTIVSGQTLTATVKVEGLSPECQNAASCTLTWLPAPQVRKFDQYVGTGKSEEVRLRYFADQLREEPSGVAYVIAYGSRRVNQHLMRIKGLLIKSGLDEKRIVLMSGGYDKKTKVELWIAPTGSAPPKPNPNFED